jgi:hypothetical protein
MEIIETKTIQPMLDRTFQKNTSIHLYIFIYVTNGTGTNTMNDEMNDKNNEVLCHIPHMQQREEYKHTYTCTPTTIFSLSLSNSKRTTTQ